MKYEVWITGLAPGSMSPSRPPYEARDSRSEGEAGLFQGRGFYVDNATSATIDGRQIKGEAYQPDPEEKLIGYVVYARNNGDWFRSRSLPKTYGTAAEAQRDIDELKRCGLTQTVREVRPLYSVPK